MDNFIIRFGDQNPVFRLNDGIWESFEYYQPLDSYSDTFNKIIDRKPQDSVVKKWRTQHDAATRLAPRHSALKMSH